MTEEERGAGVEQPAGQVVPLDMEQRTPDASVPANVSALSLQAAERFESPVVLEDRLGGLWMLESAGILEIHQS